MYTKTQVDDKVKKILANVSCIDQGAINADSYLKDDLALDSLDMAELSSKLDEKFNLSLDYEDLVRLNTVSELVDHIDHILNPIGI